MSLDKYSSSEDSNDSYHTIFHNSSTFPESTSILNLKWEDVESTLYNEKEKSIYLKPEIIQECHLWKESFPYLRVKGIRLDNEKNMKKYKMKKQIIATVVNELINKIAGEDFNISTDNEVHRPPAPKKESYFERGKLKYETLSKSEIIKPSVNVNSPGTQTLEVTSIQPAVKPPIRGILKNSPMGLHVKRNEERKPRSLLIKKDKKITTLPKLSKKNNWLNRSENDGYPRPIPSKRFNHRNKVFRQEKLILPPITPNIDFK